MDPQMHMFDYALQCMQLGRGVSKTNQMERRKTSTNEEVRQQRTCTCTFWFRRASRNAAKAAPHTLVTATKSCHKPKNRDRRTRVTGPVSSH